MVPTLNWHVHHNNLQSDHFPIIIDFPDLHITPLQNIPKFKIEKANWFKFQKSLTLPSAPFPTPDETCQKMEESLFSAAQAAIPQTPTTYKPKYNKHWWSQKCTIALNNQKESLKIYKRNLGNINLWINFKKCKAILRKAICLAKKESWSKFVKSLNKDSPSSIVWNKVKMLRNKKSFKPIILKDPSGNYISIPKQVANKLSEDLSSRGNSTDNIPIRPTLPQTFFNSNSPSYNQNLTYSELERALSMGSSSTPGPDRLPPELFRNLLEDQKIKILNILNYFWNNSLPRQWKHATIIPILKPNKIATQTSSYRPIALTNAICKIMERIITLRLKHYLEINQILSPFQSGFRTGFSTLDSLSRLENSIRTATLKGAGTLAVFLDISQAFDSVHHPSLLKKLELIGLKGNLANFIKNFLSDRTICQIPNYLL